MNDRLREAMAKLPSDKRAELEARLTAKRAGRSPAVIPRRPDPANHPLSDGQRRLLEMIQLVDDPAVYNLQRTYQLRGELDGRRLDRALTAIVNRHESLRARFTFAAGDPLQTIGPEVSTVLQSIDLSGQNGLARATARAAVAAAKPFDLEHDDLLRAELLTLGPEESVLTITAHHIGCDGWSMDVIEREVGLLYGADATSDDVLPELAVQTSDVAAWELSRRDKHDEELAYWSDQLDGTEALLLPGAGVGDERRALSGHHRLDLDAETTEGVAGLSRRLKTTPHVVYLAAWCSLLRGLTRQDDLVVCTPSAGRAHPATHDLVGYYNNIVPLRCDLGGNPGFVELVDRVRTVVLAALDNERPAFQTIARLPVVAATALTRCLLVVQDSSESGLELPGMSVTPIEVESDHADFDLELYLRRIDDRMRIVVRHRQRVLSPSEVASLCEGFQAVVKAAVADPELRLDQFPTAPGTWPQRPPTAERIAGTAPRSLLETELRRIWEQVLRTAPIGVDDDFFDLGGHSLLAAELMHEIETRIVKEPLPLAALFAAPTIAEQAKLIENGGWSQSWSSLVPIQPEGSRPPLFFVHAHGGNVIGYQPLGTHLGPDQPLFGLQAPHAGTSDQPASLEEIAANYISEIRTVRPTGPYLVGGWCLGGDIAFEMGRQLRDAGDDVALVLMVDNPRPDATAADQTVSATRQLTNRVLTRANMEWVNFTESGRSERAGYLRRRLSDIVDRASVVVEAAIDATPMRIPHSRAYRAELLARHHEKAYQEYRPQPYAGRVAILRAEHQPVGRKPDPTLGWDEALAGPRDLIEAPGHRIGLLSEPRVGPVSRLIAGALTRALAPDTDQ